MSDTHRRKQGAIARHVSDPAYSRFLLVQHVRGIGAASLESWIPIIGKAGVVPSIERYK